MAEAASRPPAAQDGPAAPAAPRPLHLSAQAALIESRQRWRDLACLASDLAFETDAEGRLSFLSPDSALGWPSEALIGRRPRDGGLLCRPDPDPFAPRTSAARDLRAWLRRADGRDACLSFAVVPLLDAQGRPAGLRGCARDVTQEVAQDAVQAEALRRALALGGLVRRVGQAVLAPRMLSVLLERLPVAVGCAGAALVTLPEAGAAAPSCPPVAGLEAEVARLAAAEAEGPVFTRGAGGEIVALLAQPHRPDSGPREALLVWREPGARPFDADDRHLLVAISDLLGVVLGNRRLLAELEHQARTEPLTGLLNRRAFLDALQRRLGRPPHGQDQGGALLFLDVDNLKPVNDRLGHEAGDALLLSVAGLLRGVARPTDLAARLGGDEFALWLDGTAQEEVVAARAEAICRAAAAIPLPPAPRAPAAAAPPPPRVSVSLGCAVALPGGAAEDATSLLARADAAMYAAKRDGRNTWRLAPAPAPA